MYINIKIDLILILKYLIIMKLSDNGFYHYKRRPVYW